MCVNVIRVVDPHLGLITSSGLAFQSMDGVRKDLQTIADQQVGLCNL